MSNIKGHKKLDLKLPTVYNERCVTSLITAAKETRAGFFSVALPVASLAAWKP